MRRDSSPTELAWPSTWIDRRDRDRTPSVPGHELAGVVTTLGYGTTGLSVGQRVFGLADWYRDGIRARRYGADPDRRGMTARPIVNEHQIHTLFFDVVGDAVVQANRTRIITFSLSARLPTIVYSREFVQAGALMSFGPNFSDQFR
jgi:Alcohol dehydrogenase GroES-like domain